MLFQIQYIVPTLTVPRRRPRAKLEEDSLDKTYLTAYLTKISEILSGLPDKDVNHNLINETKEIRSET